MNAMGTAPGQNSRLPQNHAFDREPRGSGSGRFGQELLRRSRAGDALWLRSRAFLRRALDSSVIGCEFSATRLLLLAPLNQVSHIQFECAEEPHRFELLIDLLFAFPSNNSWSIVYLHKCPKTGVNSNLHGNRTGCFLHQRGLRLQ